ncbi:hypothetical protein [Candidatus Clostridium helianthi]|uniref:Uncharacterized protein n=1 Tax=Candidatus Clostridium helianthi TaxID=3381660 RepID=A0ABW8RZG1_9CLOT
MEVNYTLICLVGIIAIALVVIGVVAIIGVYCYKYENLRIKSDTNLKTNLRDGKVEAEMSVDIDGGNQNKSKRK